MATLSPDCVYEIVPTGQRWEGHAGARAFYTELFAAFPDNAFALSEIVIGPQGAFEVATLTGTNQGPWASVPPSGLAVSVASSTSVIGGLAGVPPGASIKAWIARAPRGVGVGGPRGRGHLRRGDRHRRPSQQGGVYADDESFTFMTPEGHTLSTWITFSAERVGDVTIAQAQALERPSDPFDEFVYMLGGNPQNNKFWEATLRNLATAVGVAEPNVETKSVCIDKNRQWRYWRNIRNSATIRSMRRTLTAPVRKITGKG